MLKKSQGRENTSTVLYIFTEEDMHISGLSQFKLLFKGQLHLQNFAPKFAFCFSKRTKLLVTKQQVADNFSHWPLQVPFTPAKMHPLFIYPPWMLQVTILPHLITKLSEPLILPSLLHIFTPTVHLPPIPLSHFLAPYPQPSFKLPPFSRHSPPVLSAGAGSIPCYRR